MLKKLLSIAALTSLLVGGLSATQANAVAADVLPANVVDGGPEFSIDLADGVTEFEIPAGLTNFTVRREFYFQPEFLSTIPSQSLRLAVVGTLPNGNPLSESSMMVNTSPNYFADVYGNVFGSQSVNWSSITKQLTLPADTSTATGSITTRYYVSAPTGQTLPAGTYAFSVNLLTSGSGPVAGTEAGLEQEPLKVTVLLPQTTFVVPVGTRSTQLVGRVCVDSTKVASGDVLSAEIVLDGVPTSDLNNYWSTRSQYKSNTFPLDSAFRPQYGGNSATTTVTDYDIQWGLAVALNSYQASLVEGSSHEIAFRLYDQNGEDVSGSCAPAKPAAPQLSTVNGRVDVAGSFAVGSTGYTSQCAIYSATAPTVVVKSVLANPNYPNQANYMCSFSGLTAGETYLVKFRDAYNSAYSEYSDSSSILVPSPGYTIPSNYPGVVEAKKIVKVSDNVLPIENYGLSPRLSSDGIGGFYLVGENSGSCPPQCSLQSIRIRKASPTALDTTFAETGSVIISSFVPVNAFSGLMGFYGANKDKWAIPVNGRDSVTNTGQSQIFLGSTSSSTVTSQLINASDLNALCDAAASGYVASTGGSMNISILSASTTDVTIRSTCSKSNPIGVSQFTSFVPILVAMNASTGALTLKASFGTPGAEVNNIAAIYTVNTAATGTEPMVTAFVTSSKTTQVNNPPTPNTGTITDRSVVRLDSNFNLLSTTSAAWGTAGATIAEDRTLTVPGLNSGKIFALSRFGTSYKALTLGATGVATELDVDATSSEIATPAITVVGGQPTPSNETLFPVSVSASGKDAAGWIDLTTGVLTVGEVLSSTFGSGAGVTKAWFLGADKSSYLVLSTTNTPANMTVLKWIDSRYVAPVGAVPAVTSKDVKYSKNTPTVGAKVTLTGTNLDAVISAKIGANAATLGTKSATSLQLTIPTASAAGTVDITLTTATGDTIVDTFTYVGAGVAQTVTVGALASSVTVGDADLALSATVVPSQPDAGTPGAITWSSETPLVCSIVANKARLLTAGTCTVKATAAVSGLLLAGSGTQSTTVSAATVVAAAQTVTLTGPTKVVVDLDGFDVVSSASSGLPVVYSTTTPTICTVTSAGRVVAIAEGTCEITSSQAGNASWLAATKTLTITVAKTPSTPVTEKGDIKKPLALSKTGTFLKNGDAQLGWNRSKGTLAVKLSVVYVGPVKASISFKVGSKTYTCTSSFGILKKQSSSKLQTITSPNLCTGKTEKTQLAALKKITTSTVVTVTIVRDMYLPTTYKKIRTKTRILYAKLG